MNEQRRLDEQAQSDELSSALEQELQIRAERQAQAADERAALSRQVEASQERMDRVQSNLGVILERLDGIETQLSQERQEATEWAEKAGRLQTQLENSEAALERTEGALAEAETELENRAQRLEALRAERAELERTEVRTEARLAEQQAKVDQAQARLDQAIAQHERTVRGLEDELAALEEERADLRARVGRLTADTDGDGTTDRVDLCPESTPDTATNDFGCPMELSLKLEGVRFATGTARLPARSRAILDGVAGQLQRFSTLRLEVAGHTDSRGSAALNQRLSQRRADAVRDYLLEQGIAADRLTAKGYGEAFPIATNDSMAGRAVNRRVELRLRR